MGIDKFEFVGKMLRRFNMWFWWFILLCDLLVPVIMFVGGIIMSKNCPNNINVLFGYRTARSMKNMDTWKFAHEYCGKLWKKVSLISFIITVLVHIPFYHSNEDVIGILSVVVMFIQIISLIAPIFLTEKALDKTFNKDGTRR